MSDPFEKSLVEIDPDDLLDFETPDLGGDFDSSTAENSKASLGASFHKTPPFKDTEFKSYLEQWHAGNAAPMLKAFEPKLRNIASKLIGKRNGRTAVEIEELISVGQAIIWEKISKNNFPPEDPIAHLLKSAKNQMVELMTNNITAAPITGRTVREYERAIQQFEVAASQATTHAERARIARAMGTTIDDIETKKAIVYNSQSLNAETNKDSDNPNTVIDTMAADPYLSGPAHRLDSLQNTIYIHVLLENAGLNDKEKFVLYHHVYSDDPMPFDEIARLLNTSEHYVGTIKNRAIAKLRDFAAILEKDQILYRTLYQEQWKKLESGTHHQVFIENKTPAYDRNKPVAEDEPYTLHNHPVKIITTNDITNDYESYASVLASNLPVLVARGKQKDISGILLTAHIAKALAVSCDLNPTPVNSRDFTKSFSKVSDNGTKALSTEFKRKGIRVMYVPLKKDEIQPILKAIEANSPPTLAQTKAVDTAPHTALEII